MPSYAPGCMCVMYVCEVSADVQTMVCCMCGGPCEHCAHADNFLSDVTKVTMSTNIKPNLCDVPRFLSL